MGPVTSFIACTVAVSSVTVVSVHYEKDPFDNDYRVVDDCSDDKDKAEEREDIDAVPHTDRPVNVARIETGIATTGTRVTLRS